MWLPGARRHGLGIRFVDLLLIPKSKRNRENKRYLTSKAIIRLLDQFVKGQMDVKAFDRQDYGGLPRFRGAKNKANQSQFVSSATVGGVELLCDAGYNQHPK